MRNVTAEIRKEHNNPFGSEPIFRAYRLDGGNRYPLYIADTNESVVEARLKQMFSGDALTITRAERQRKNVT